MKIKSVSGRGLPLPGNEIDTDRIIPARYLKCVTFDDLGKYAFYDARFNDDGSPKAHPFNDARYKGASILVVGKNFGCGSSREHAPQSLKRYGIAAIVVVLAGIIVTRLDTSMGTVWDGMWYSWVTISHTGYGDIVPKTPAARLFGGVLILLGVVLFTVLTASLSAFLIGTEVEKVEKEEFKADVMLEDILTRLERIEQKLEEKQKL